VTERLPLFPLGTVLFPGLLLPLHIFEERYRLLVRTLIELPEGSRRRFGVVTIREGREVGSDGVRALHAVGCVAELSQARRYEDGRFDIVTIGSDRFRLRGIDDTLPYLQGDVDFLPEEPGDEAAALSFGVAQQFARYRTAVLSGQDSDADEGSSTEPDTQPVDPSTTAMADQELPSDPIVLSYAVAAAMVVDTVDKQRLLEAADAAERLRVELALLRREAGLLRRLSSLPAVDLVRQGMSPN
jgi:uncharacterized protein